VKSKRKLLMPALLLLLAVASIKLPQVLGDGTASFWWTVTGGILFIGAAATAVRQTRAARDAADSPS
jgi:hypothetical protein